jgi:hypothetical protein
MNITTTTTNSDDGTIIKNELNLMSCSTTRKVMDQVGVEFTISAGQFVFVYHNSAPSYYGVRAFRGSLRV